MSDRGSGYVLLAWGYMAACAPPTPEVPPHVDSGQVVVVDSDVPDSDIPEPEMFDMTYVVDPEGVGGTCDDTRSCEDVSDLTPFCSIRRVLDCLDGQRPGVVDGDFELGLASAWTLGAPDDPAAAGSGWRDATVCRFGRGCAQLVVEPEVAAAGLVTNSFPLTQDGIQAWPGPVRLSAWLKTSEDGGLDDTRMQFTVFAHDAAGERLPFEATGLTYSAFYEAGGTSSWRYIQTDPIWLPPGTDTASLRVRKLCELDSSCPSTRFQVELDGLDLVPVVSSSMEEDDNADGVPDGWCVSADDGSCVSGVGAVTLDTVHSHTGHQSVRIEGSNTEVRFSQLPIRVQGAHQQAWGWFRAEGVDVGSARLHVRSIDSQGQVLSEDVLELPAGSYDWTELSLTADAVPASAMYLEAEVRLAAGASGTLWVDDLVVRRLHPDRTRVLLRSHVSQETCLEIPASGATSESTLVIETPPDEAVTFSPSAEALACQHPPQWSSPLFSDCNRQFIWGIRGQQHIEIRGLDFDVDVNTRAIRLGQQEDNPLYVDGVSLRELEIANNGACEAISGHGARDAVIADSTFLGGPLGVVAYYGLPNYDIQVRDSVFRGQSSKSLVLATSTGDQESRVEGNVFEDSYIAIDTMAHHTIFADNRFAEVIGGLEVVGTHLTALGNVFEDVGMAMHVRHEEDFLASLHGTLDGVEADGALRFRYVTTLSTHVLPEHIEDARVVRASQCRCLGNLDDPESDSGAPCNWMTLCADAELRELASYTRTAAGLAEIRPSVPFSEVTAGDRLLISRSITDVELLQNHVAGARTAAVATSKKASIDPTMASIRRLVVAGNLIEDVRSIEATPEPSNPPGALSFAHLSGETEVSGNRIRGGTAHGIVLRGLDAWSHLESPETYDVVFTDNCVTPRDAGFSGIYRKESRPVNATLRVTGNRYGSVEDASVDPEGLQLGDYAADNDSAYVGDCP